MDSLDSWEETKMLNPTSTLPPSQEGAFGA